MYLQDTNLTVFQKNNQTISINSSTTGTDKRIQVSCDLIIFFPIPVAR